MNTQAKIKDHVVYILGPEKSGKSEMLAKLLAASQGVEKPLHDDSSLCQLRVGFRATHIEGDTVCFFEAWEVPLHQLDFLKRTILKRVPQCVIIVVDPNERNALHDLQHLHNEIHGLGKTRDASDESSVLLRETVQEKSHDSQLNIICVASKIDLIRADTEHENLSAMKAWASLNRVQFVEFSSASWECLQDLRKLIRY